MRKLTLDLSRTIFEKADRRYRDLATGHFIALKQVVLRGRDRLVMVAHDQLGEGVK